MCIDSTPLEKRYSHRVLRVIIQSDLKWNMHINSITLKRLHMLRALTQLWHSTPRSHNYLHFPHQIYSGILLPGLEHHYPSLPFWQARENPASCPAYPLSVFVLFRYLERLYPPLFDWTPWHSLYESLLKNLSPFLPHSSLWFVNKYIRLVFNTVLLLYKWRHWAQQKCKRNWWVWDEFKCRLSLILG